MNQENASRYADEMEKAIAAFHQREGWPALDARMSQFKGAAFSQLFEVIPDEARGTVITIDGLPLFVAVDGNQFYKVAFEDFAADSEDIPITWCEVTRVDPESGVFKMESRYDSGAMPLVARETAWTFRFGDSFHLTFSTCVVAGANPTEDEVFARALAQAMGWPGVNPETQR